MSAPRIAAATANIMLDEGIGLRSPVGKLGIYDGTQPATGGAAITSQVKLAEFTLDATGFLAAVGGVLTASSIGPTSAIATGLATWFRLTGIAGVHLLDGDVGENPPGTADCILSDTDLTTLDVLAVISLTITQPLQ